MSQKNVEIVRRAIDAQDRGTDAVTAKRSRLAVLEATLPVHAPKAEHPVHSGLSRRVTLRQLLRRIARSFALETLPLAPAFKPARLRLLFLRHDSPLEAAREETAHPGPIGVLAGGRIAALATLRDLFWRVASAELLLALLLATPR
jgi:hypothetical protein